MVKSENSKGKEIVEILSREINRFNKLIEGHKKLLRAIAGL